MKYIVVAGNPRDGLFFHGPFDKAEDALEYAENELRKFDWWLAPLESVEV